MVFLSNDQSLSESHHIRTKYNVVIHETPRDLGCLSGIRVKKTNTRIHDAPSVLITQEITTVLVTLVTLSQELGSKTKCQNKSLVIFATNSISGTGGQRPCNAYLCLSSCLYHTILIAVTLQLVLESGGVSPLSLFYFFKIIFGSSESKIPYEFGYWFFYFCTQKKDH